MALEKLRASMALSIFLLLGTLTAVFGAILWLAGPSLDLTSGLAAAVGFAAVITLAQWYLAPSIIKLTTRMRQLPESEYPWLHQLVEKHARRAGIPTPKLFLVMDGTPNAFAFGRTRSSANLAVHSGLLNTLTKDEVEGVVAHEVGHIKHWDVAVITMASMVPLIVYYAIVFAGSSLLGRNRDQRGGGEMIAVWLGAYAAQFLSFLIVMQLSRTREFYADAFSAASTGKPELLRSALTKIAYGFPANAPLSAYRDKRAFYIADPVQAVDEARETERREEAGVSAKEVDHAIEWERRKGGFTEWFSTHPLTYKRLDALKQAEEDIKAGRLTLANA